MKLNPESLVVDTFDTTTESSFSPEQPIGIPTGDPTDATRCYICPMETYRCY